MTRLDKLIELNKLQKLNRTNRLEDKLKQQEYYGEIEDLFDPLTKTLNTNAETMQALQNKTLAELDSNTNTLKSLGHHQQNSFLDERAALLTPTPDTQTTLKDDRGQTFAVDNDMIGNLLLVGKRTNKQFRLILVDPISNKFKINDVDVSLVPDGIKIKGKVYDFSKGFALFITNKDVTERDIKGDEIKIKQILRDIGYKQRGDTKSNRSKLIRRMFSSMGEPTSRVISIPTSIEDEIYCPDTSDYEQVIVEAEEEATDYETDYETDKQIEASGLRNPNQRSCHHYVYPNNQVERLELLILEPKAGHDGLYDEMLDISKQLLSMNIINQEQLDNFVLNYVK